MSRAMCTFSLLFLLCLLMSFCPCENGNFKIEYQWTFINYTWPSAEAYNDAITTKKYIPENNLVAGLKHYKNKFYMAVPRMRVGTPITLGYISEDSPKMNPLITPYPNWEMNQADDCNRLYNVIGLEIDKSGTMWVLDGLRLTTNKCPPKLVLFDLNKGRLLHTFIFPEQVCLSDGGFLNDIVIDDSDGGFAYITDNSLIDPGLVVYSRKLDRSWKIRDASMFAEEEASEFVVGGHKNKRLFPIDGIALSPLEQSGSRILYYCALSGFTLYSITTEILKDEEACSGDFWRFEVEKIGRKRAQGDGLVIDNEGNLYYGLLPLYTLVEWNIYEPFSSSEIVDQEESMVWIEGFAFDTNGSLYMLTNRIDIFFDEKYILDLNDKVSLEFSSHILLPKVICIINALK